MDRKARRFLRDLVRRLSPIPKRASSSEQRRMWDRQTRRTQEARAARTKRTLP